MSSNEDSKKTIASWSRPRPAEEPAAPAPQQPQQPYYQQPQQPPQYPQQPYYQQPQYPQQPYQQAPPQPQGPMTVKQALEKSKQDIFGKYLPNSAQQAAPAPAPPQKKKRSVLGWIVIILIGFAILAMQLGL